MRLVYCCDPSDTRKPDEAFEAEAAAAGLPERADPEAFYRALRDHWPAA